MEELIKKLEEALALAKKNDCGWQVTEPIVTAIRAVKRYHLQGQGQTTQAGPVGGNEVLE